MAKMMMRKREGRGGANLSNSIFPGIGFLFFSSGHCHEASEFERHCAHSLSRDKAVASISRSMRGTCGHQMCCDAEFPGLTIFNCPKALCPFCRFPHLLYKAKSSDSWPYLFPFGLSHLKQNSNLQMWWSIWGANSINYYLSVQLSHI